MDSSISGQAKIKSAGSKLASNGSIRLDDPLIRGTKVGYPITLDYDAADDLNSDVIQIKRGDIKLGATPITIAGTINTKANPAQIDLKITAANASISEAARLASAFGVAFGNGMDVNGQVNMNIQARGSAGQPQLNGQVSASNLSISGKQLPQPVKVNSVELALTPDSIHSNDFTASEGSTNVTGSFALAHYTTPNSTITAALRAPGARIGELLNIGQAAGVSSLDGMSGDGTLTLDVHAQGPQP
jgi:autotransporter translocation and assembly factor TamB